MGFWCPGCDDAHVFKVGPGHWTWNGNVELPTFTPSLMIRSGHFADGFKAGDDCWCTYNAAHPNEPAPFKCRVCHLNVTDGRIQFHSDCTHALVGQTVELPYPPT